jgi:hypothetical protein
MITFPATDIEYALQAEIDSLKAQLAAYRTKGLDTATRRTEIDALRKECDALRAENERLRVIEAAHHRVIDALWGGEKSPAVGKEWGNNLDAYGQVVGGIGKITF